MTYDIALRRYTSKRIEEIESAPCTGFGFASP